MIDLRPSYHIFKRESVRESHEAAGVTITLFIVWEFTLSSHRVAMSVTLVF